MAGFLALIAPSGATLDLPGGFTVPASEVQRVRRDDLGIGRRVGAEKPFGIFVGSPCSQIP